MPNKRCPEIILSEDYASFILETNSITDEYLINHPDECVQYIDNTATILYRPLSAIPDFSLNTSPYSTIPRLYGFMDTSALDSINAVRLQNLSNLELKGQGTIVGFIDAGIDYTHPAFLDSSGNSRISIIWDQTIPQGSDSMSAIPSDAFVPFGTLYDNAAINTALRSGNPTDIVPSTDTTGHGTFLAGVCAGSSIAEDDFSGVVPEAQIAVVKLKPAKKYLRDYFLIREDAICFQEDDIMSAASFLIRYATLVRLPMIICIGLGSSQGPHIGISPLATQLNSYSLKAGCAVCLPIGNEGDTRKHFAGTISPPLEYQDVELHVGANDSGFCAELWGRSPDVFSVSITSPSGETIPRIPARLGQSSTYSFLFDSTVLNIEYAIVEDLSGTELILFRFMTPAEGIWRIRVYSANNIFGSYNIWLPISNFTGEDNYFLKPSPDITLTTPGSSTYPMSVAAYNHYNDSLYISSSRGFTANGIVTPDFAAPGVDVFGPASGGGYTAKTGTSISAAFTAGVAAQFMTWAVTLRRFPNLNGLALKNYLIRGAKRVENETYPNNRVGYGILDSFRAFDIIREN